MLTKTPKVDIFFKDSRNMIEVGSNSVELIITSPPYGYLKDYQTDDQIGLNQKYSHYIQNLNLVWKECVRVLTPDGKLCINIMPLFESGNETEFKRRPDVNSGINVRAFTSFLNPDELKDMQQIQETKDE